MGNWLHLSEVAEMAQGELHGNDVSVNAIMLDAGFWVLARVKRQF